MNIGQSKAVAWGAMILMVVVIVIAIVTKVITDWWECSVLFLAFMAIFSHLAALLLAKMSTMASKKLDLIALIFSFLAIVAFIVIFILDWIAM